MLGYTHTPLTFPPDNKQEIYNSFSAEMYVEYPDKYNIYRCFLGFSFRNYMENAQSPGFVNPNEFEYSPKIGKRFNSLFVSFDGGFSGLWWKYTQPIIALDTISGDTRELEGDRINKTFPGTTVMYFYKIIGLSVKYRQQFFQKKSRHGFYNDYFSDNYYVALQFHLKATIK